MTIIQEYIYFFLTPPHLGRQEENILSLWKEEDGEIGKGEGRQGGKVRQEIGINPKREGKRKGNKGERQEKEKDKEEKKELKKRKEKGKGKKKETKGKEKGRRKKRGKERKGEREENVKRRK